MQTDIQKDTHANPLSYTDKQTNMRIDKRTDRRKRGRKKNCILQNDKSEEEDEKDKENMTIIKMISLFTQSPA